VISSQTHSPDKLPLGFLPRLRVSFYCCCGFFFLPAFKGSCPAAKPSSNELLRWSARVCIGIRWNGYSPMIYGGNAWRSPYLRLISWPHYKPPARGLLQSGVCNVLAVGNAGGLCVSSCSGKASFGKLMCSNLQLTICIPMFTLWVS
jgi:hypothetical protein